MRREDGTRGRGPAERRNNVLDVNIISTGADKYCERLEIRARARARQVKCKHRVKHARPF